MYVAHTATPELMGSFMKFCYLLFSVLASSSAAPEKNKTKAEFSETDAVMDLPNQTKAHFHPVSVDGDSLNTIAGSIDKDDSSVSTVAATEATGRRKRDKPRIRRRKQANVLTFQFKSRQKPIKILLRGKQLLALLSNKSVFVASAKFDHPRLLPTGSLVASRFILSLVRLQSRTDQRLQRHSVMCGDRNVPNHSQWMEIERTRLRNSKPSTCVHQLQQKLTKELDSAAAMDADTDSLLSNKQTTEQDINRTSIPDEIDDIFGALDD